MNVLSEEAALDMLSCTLTVNKEILGKSCHCLLVRLKYFFALVDGHIKSQRVEIEIVKII